MIKAGRENGKGAPAAADLLVCFPSRAHLRLMPKPICSPVRPQEPNKRLHHLKTSGTRGGGSPLMWAKSKSFGSGPAELGSEPTSPKVTCAGQIKVRHKVGPCKSWQSVMEEIEKMHKTNHRKDTQSKKRPGFAEALGFKKEVMQFLTCLRTIRFDFRCFGSFHGADITSDEDDDEDDDGEDEEEEMEAKSGEIHHDQAQSSRTMFSKWFMVLQEEQKCNDISANNRDNDQMVDDDEVGRRSADDEPVVPPPNALLLMRCRSAPAKSWLKERGVNQEERSESELTISKRSLRYLMDEDEKNTGLVLMTYEPDSYNMSLDIAKETWLVGDLSDHLARSRSWKR